MLTATKCTQVSFPEFGNPRTYTHKIKPVKQYP